MHKGAGKERLVKAHKGTEGRRIGLWSSGSRSEILSEPEGRRWSVSEGSGEACEGTGIGGHRRAQKDTTNRRA